MVIRHTAPLGASIWIDLTSSDVDRAQEFYGTVFDWTFESAGPDYGGYITAAKDGHPVAGLMARDPAGAGLPTAPDAWATYLHTADIAASVAASIAAGGASCLAAMEVKDQGWMAMLTDPSGAVFGLWQPIDHHGFEVVGEAGAPVWHELTTRDYAAAVKFYTEVFGWRTEQISDTDEFRYTTAWFGDELGAPPAGGGVLGVVDAAKFMPVGVPSNWGVYLGAEDVDKTIAVITDNGGTVLRPANDTPYGRLAQVTDPTGAMFALSSLRD